MLAFMTQKHVSSVPCFYVLVDDYGSVSQILWAGFSFSFLRGKSWANVIEINRLKIRLYRLNQWGSSNPINLLGPWFFLSQTHIPRWGGVYRALTPKYLVQHQQLPPGYEIPERILLVIHHAKTFNFISSWVLTIINSFWAMLTGSPQNRNINIKWL